GFTYCATSGGDYTTTLIVSPSSGSISQVVYVKFTPTAIQSYNGDIAVSGGGASTVNRSVTGSGINTLATVTTTSPATAVTNATATLSGNVSDGGCQTITARGFCYGTSASPDLTATVTTETGTTGAVSSNITGLTPATMYHFRAYATSSAGTSYGADATFSTISNPPTDQATNLAFTNTTTQTYTVTFTAASSGADNYLVLRGTTAPTGTPVNATSYTQGQTNIGSGTNKVAYVGPLTTFNETGLTANTTYYYTIYSYNGTGATANYLTENPLSGNTTTTALTTLSTPTVGTATKATLTGFTASWTAVANATSYAINVYDGTSTLVVGSPKTVAGATSATLAITGMLLPSNNYTYTVTAIGDNVSTYASSVPSDYSASFTTATSTGTYTLQYAVSDVATLNADLKGGAADIYELTESGGTYTFNGTTTANNTLVRNTTIRAAAGLANKPILKISSTSTSSTSSIINTTTTNLTVRFDGLEFTGVNTGTYSPIAFYSTGADTKLYVTNCYFHDFLEAATGNGTLRLDGVSTAQVMDVQGSNFNNCGGRVLYNNAASGTTLINIKNCTFSNFVVKNSRCNVVYNNAANAGTQTYDHCTFYNIATSTTSPIFIKGAGGLVTIKNCLFGGVTGSDGAIALTQPLTFNTTITDCYVGGLATAPSGNSNSISGTIATAPAYTNPAIIDFSLTNKSFFTATTDGYIAGNTSYYNLAIPTIGTGSDATSGGFTANWTAVANASSYDVNVYQGASLISTTNASG
ncbi:MAG: hypothetical protein ACOYLO_14035, partial [Ferruginibacter sp.]